MKIRKTVKMVKTATVCAAIGGACGWAAVALGLTVSTGGLIALGPIAGALYGAMRGAAIANKEDNRKDK